MKVALSVFLLGLSAAAALAGPNADGTLILHYESGLAYTSDGVPFQGSLADCRDAVAQMPPAAVFPPPDRDLRVWYAYAAFPPGRMPRLKMVEFGIDYPEYAAGIGVKILWTQAPPGAMTLGSPGSEWPAPHSSVLVVFGETMTAEVDAVFAFAGYGSDGMILRLTRSSDPSIQNSFGDNSSSTRLDRIEGYGSIGFGVPGALFCPAPVQGACCSTDGSCRVATPRDCAESGDSYQADFVYCDYFPCPVPPGACCLPDGECRVLSETACVSYEFQGLYFGSGTACVPISCPQPPPPTLGACCRQGRPCLETVRWACSGGFWLIGVSCSPDPCLQDPEPGACCDRRTGLCSVIYGRACLVGGDPTLWLGSGTDCDPMPCPQAEPVGACCFIGGECRLKVQRDCASGDFHAGEPCSAVPCAVPEDYGACCLADYSCEILRRASCESGDWRAEESCSVAACAPIFGACCLSSGECVYSQDDACDSGDWRIDVFCAPGLCPIPFGACCDLPNLTCSILAEAQCLSHSSAFWQEGEAACAPNPCLSLQDHGACCVVDECLFLSESECAEVQGNFMPLTPCPAFCLEPLIDQMTWGKIKARFRE